MRVGSYSQWVIVLRNTNLDSPNIFTDPNPQAYGTIIIAFHLGVFQGIVIYIFPKECKVFVSSNDIDKITYMHDGHSLCRGRIGITRIVDTHLDQPQG
jgi:hypothetical protein